MATIILASILYQASCLLLCSSTSSNSLIKIDRLHNSELLQLASDLFARERRLIHRNRVAKVGTHTRALLLSGHFNDPNFWIWMGSMYIADCISSAHEGSLGALLGEPVLWKCRVHDETADDFGKLIYCRRRKGHVLDNDNPDRSTCHA